MFSGLIIIVDLEGVEPSSKQGSHMLSTCTDALHAYIPHLSLSKPNKPKISINFPQR